MKLLKVRDWTTRKSRDFNEEYPKLRYVTFCVLPVPCITFVSYVSPLKMFMFFLFELYPSGQVESSM